jgi:hypothetical protein
MAEFCLVHCNVVLLGLLLAMSVTRLLGRTVWYLDQKASSTFKSSMRGRDSERRTGSSPAAPVGLAVLMESRTLDRKYACRRFWATIQATRSSTFYAGLLGALIGAALLVPIWFIAHKLNGHILALPWLLGFLSARLFPRFVVIDAAIGGGGNRSERR